ncbi:PDZ domain-containing protein [Longimicrobium terrae]|uniref:Membrane-associated protease RseP (Regulator of RpoE activity) n=1 Tax=Longimicrobium terrae TaxID=1639882 RepID=A0A841GXZ9_9BACT|nr:PDZ domain-containing protein [Longimicrobium terrae]MBB4636227.1 membrane-associated protease RseP (regulator of RpoE activity) [Longimicrobium terrae]MBB6070622.1 membrane-associated protease RseP (regulator of RpoE activity) [Longimicrobium terrae]NNC29607.1 PDZ domain-containing protein [Longimicrobium terrae]
MKLRTLVLPLLAAMLAFPAAARAQNDSTPSRRPGMLGFTFDVRTRQTSDAPAQHTIRVTDVLAGSAAARAGMREGDLIVQVNGAPVADVPQASPLLQVNEGDAVRIRVRRVDGEHELRMVAGARPASQLAGMAPSERRRVIIREGVPGAPGAPMRERRRVIVRGADSLTGTHDDEVREIIIERDSLVRRGERRRLEVTVDSVRGRRGELRRTIVIDGDTVPHARMHPSVERRVVVINGDTVRDGEGFTMTVDTLSFPVQWLASRMDSLIRVVQTDSFIASRLDSLTVVLRDSLPRLLQFGPTQQALRELPDMQRQIIRLGEQTSMINVGPSARAFFMDAGRAAAAGAQLAEMNEGLSRYFGGTSEGVLVLEVSPGSPARRAGLEAGDIIVGVEGGVVQRPEDVRAALTRDEDGSMMLNVVRQGRRREITLQWDPQRDWVRVLAPSTVELDMASPHAPPSPPRP